MAREGLQALEDVMLGEECVPCRFEFELVVLVRDVLEHVWRILAHDGHVHDQDGLFRVLDVPLVRE